MTGFNGYELDVIYSGAIIAKLQLSRETSELGLIYSDAWVANGFPISPPLGLSDDIRPSSIRKYLENLLPENQGLDYLIEHLGVSRKNVFSLIKGIGVDTSGAVMFVMNYIESQVETTFRPIDDAELIMRLSDPTVWKMEIWDDKPRLSVAGVQSKINVLKMNDQLGFGDGDLCSTHIIKFEKNDQQHLVLNEFLTMNLAKSVGLDVANVEFRYFGQYPALLVERFDRKLVGSVVKRRHVIDSCQALDASVDMKYERNLGGQRDVKHIRDGVSLSRLFGLAELCENPIATKLALLNWTLFNLCVFNCDSHGKNFSFFVTKNGLKATPLYDLVNVRMYPEFEQDLAMALGDEFDSDTVNAYQLVDFAEDCNINRRLLRRSLVMMAEQVLSGLGMFDAAMDTVGTPASESQEEYIARYKDVVTLRCSHLIEQSHIIDDIEL